MNPHIEQLNEPVVGDLGMPLDTKCFGYHNLNSFDSHNSASRDMMFGSMMHQLPVLKESDEPICVTGSNIDLADNTFSITIENDSRVLSVIDRYSGMFSEDVGIKTVDKLLIYEDIETCTIEAVVIPKVHSMHTYFGFEYIWNDEVIDSLVVDTVIPAGTVLARSPGVKENGGYGFGRLVNTCNINLPETSEDSMIISDELLDMYKFDIFEKYSNSWGNGTYAGNAYGDVNNYQAFPELGQKLRDDAVLMFNKTFGDDMVSTSALDHMDVDNNFDAVKYTRKGEGQSEVVDIKAYVSGSERATLTGTNDLIHKYAEALINYYKDIIKCYENIEDNIIYKDCTVSPFLTNLIRHAYMLANPDNEKIQRVYKKDPMDTYKIEFIIKTQIIPDIGYKYSGIDGDKSINTVIWPAHCMPVDDRGNRAHIITDPGTSIARANLARLYSMYTNGVSICVKWHVIQDLKRWYPDMDPKDSIKKCNNIQVEELLKHYIEPVSIISGGDLKYLLKDSIEGKRETLLHGIEKNFQFIIKAEGNKTPEGKDKSDAEIMQQLSNSKYRPYKGKIRFTRPGTTEVIVSDKDIMIAPMYLLLLDKIPDAFLAVNSSKTNHYDLPTGVNKSTKIQSPVKNNPLRMPGESETRPFIGYGSPKFLAEIRNMNLDSEVHNRVYTELLTLKNPVDTQTLVDRSIYPYGDPSVRMLKTLMKSLGFDINRDEE